MLLSYFIRQKSYEHIVARVRHSPATLALPLLLLIILLAVPLGLYLFIASAFPALLNHPVISPLLILSGSIYLLIMVLLTFAYFVDFYLDLLVITNDRLIRIEQHGLFARSVFEVDLYQIQNATSEVKGALPSLLHYGDLIIETAGAQPKKVGRRVPDPHGLRRLILDLSEADKRYHQGGSAPAA
ncbi:MAG: PH domain-containing protein [Candidatus Magasanikbacteria bacterium]|nr:PH domain-containing protein [Candidatus Magasanikbacteria bacterium]